MFCGLILRGNSVATLLDAEELDIAVAVIVAIGDVDATVNNALLGHPDTKRWELFTRREKVYGTLAI